MFKYPKLGFLDPKMEYFSIFYRKKEQIAVMSNLTRQINAKWVAFATAATHYVIRVVFTDSKPACSE